LAGTEGGAERGCDAPVAALDGGSIGGQGHARVVDDVSDFRDPGRLDAPRELVIHLAHGVALRWRIVRAERFGQRRSAFSPLRASPAAAPFAATIRAA
jgi:hypothetical protein